MYTVPNHVRFSKSLTQIAMVLNRMTCVLFPTSYDKIWRKMTPVVWVCLILLPFAGNWNCLISRIYMDSFRGGFTMNYMRAVDWAALSMFQSVFILTALLFTVICTLITVYKLVLLPGRVKSIEKSLCMSCIFLSCSFLLVGASQAAIAFCPICRTQTYFSLFNAQLIAFDVFTVGSAVIMIITDTKLRSAVFPCKFREDKPSVEPSKVRVRSAFRSVSMN
ncbi:Protein CBG20980 [Caenorhabditis briggsae]|uniref:Serpentine receptor class gamma n=1 Tax=Caenorhabditis briggsae TaxID=6238 RepID=A8XZ33_CAEBR|nr:Protein CBG20980 [Caenorhabditis briggsae]CAP37900.2 Protein CBG20980 [Caenorhabditis briggsae]